MILVQLLEMMRIMFYTVGGISILGGILLLLFREKFEAKHKRKIIIFAIVLILYGICAVTVGVYYINSVIAYHKTI